MMEDPDFTPGAVRAVLEELDGCIEQVQSNIILHAKSWDEVLLLRGKVLGLMQARAIQHRHMDDEIKKRLGIKP
jgi:hypothetical protein